MTSRDNTTRNRTFSFHNSYCKTSHLSNPSIQCCNCYKKGHIAPRCLECALTLEQEQEPIDPPEDGEGIINPLDLFVGKEESDGEIEMDEHVNTVRCALTKSVNGN